jgi:TonB family protein
LTVILLGAPPSASAQATTPVACAHPDVPASAIHVVPPEMPAMALWEGIHGTVHVEVALDANSKVTLVRIASSASNVLNFAALTSARSSVFQTQIQNCRPIASTFVLALDFESPECPQAYVPAHTVQSAPADYPEMARLQGIRGTVQVEVQLDEQSRPIRYRIFSSPSALLNDAALASAHNATFATEMIDCRPRPSVYLYGVTFGY